MSTLEQAQELYGRFDNAYTALQPLNNKTFKDDVIAARHEIVCGMLLIAKSELRQYIEKLERTERDNPQAV